MPPARPQRRRDAIDFVLREVAERAPRFSGATEEGPRFLNG